MFSFESFMNFHQTRQNDGFGSILRKGPEWCRVGSPALLITMFLLQVTREAEERKVINRKFIRPSEITPMSQDDRRVLIKILDRREQTKITPDNGRHLSMATARK